MFNLNSPVFRKMEELFDLILLNILFLLTCLPIITIGASLTALHTVSMKLAAGDSPYIIRSFFRAFKDNFRQATCAWLFMLFVGAFLYVDMGMAVNGGAAGGLFRIVFGFLMILFLFEFLYLFPMLSRYRNTLSNLMKNSLVMALRALPKTILLAIVFLAPIFMALYGSQEVFLLVAILYLIIGFSVTAGVHDRIILGIFHYYDELAAQGE